MPYIITTETEHWAGPTGGTRVFSSSSVAVGTPEKARDRIICDPLSAHDEHPLFPHWRSQALMLPESGGIIGPLPDGTVIEVMPTEWQELFRVAYPRQHPEDMHLYADWEILVAYNAKQH